MTTFFIIPGDTPQPRITRYAITDGLDLFVSDRGQAWFRHTHPNGKIVTLDVDVTLDNGHIYFDRRELAEEYGREIPGVTSTPDDNEPLIVPITPEEALLIHNLRAIGASRLQIWVTVQNHRHNQDDAALGASLLESGATDFEITSIRDALRRARAEDINAGSLTPRSIDEIFPDIRTADPDGVIRPENEHWHLLPEALVGSDEAALAEGQRLIAQTYALEPDYEPVGFPHVGHLPVSIQTRSDYLNELRFRRAVAIARTQGNYGPLQVELLRNIQIDVDAAYASGEAELNAGSLSIRLSDREALGNHIDGYVRRNARDRLRRAGVNWETDAQIRIQRREYDALGNDRTYRVPDAAIFDIMFDATIRYKSPRDGQIRGFFASLSRPRGVAIVRPTELGGSYFIMPPHRDGDTE